jgi:hypothetical protein
MVKGLLNSYLKAQRDAIIGEQKLEREARLAAEKREQLVRESQTKYLKDQIELLKEELQNTRKEEGILECAQIEV